MDSKRAQVYDCGMMHQVRKELENTLKHALSYLARLSMQAISNFWHVLKGQQILQVCICAIIALAYNVYLGIIEWDKASLNWQSVIYFCGTLLILLVLMSLLTAPFHLDREWEEENKALENRSSLPFIFQENKNLQPVTTKTEPDSEPNIIVLETPNINAGFNPRKNVWTETLEAENKSVVVKFVNEPIKNQKIGTLQTVRAQISFFNRKGDREHRVDEGAWFDIPGWVNFECATVNKLLIASESNKCFMVENGTPIGRALYDNYYQVEVRLVDSHQWQETFRFELRRGKYGRLMLTELAE